MKVVINTCYGGFSLSRKAVKRLAELQGKECYFYSKGGLNTAYVKIEETDINERLCLWFAFTVGNPDKLNEMLNSENWHEMSKAEKAAYNKRYKEIYLSDKPDNRADNLLIQVVEELGEDANGAFAKLKIVDIPDGTDYEISEYDGYEHIAEKHRTWS